MEGVTVTYTEDPSAITAETGSDAERQPPETEGKGTEETETETETLPSFFPFLTVLLSFFAATAAVILLLRKKNRKASKGMKPKRRT